MQTYRQPFKGDYPISQGYGELIPGVTYKDRPHTGIDYACPVGTEILASADGIVKYSGYEKTGYGNWIVIEHEKGKCTLYAHLSERNVFANQKVRQGDVIGLSGNTGNSTGPHLHFEARRVWCDWRSHFDPMSLPLMNVFEKSEIGNQKSDIEDSQQPAASSRQAGVYQVVCEAAWVRDWATLSRVKLIYKGERVYLFEDRKEMDGLTFYYIGAGYAMAAFDAEGTRMLDSD